MNRLDERATLDEILQEVFSIGRHKEAGGLTDEKTLFAEAKAKLLSWGYEEALGVVPDKRTKSSEGYPNAEKLEAWKDGYNKCRAEIRQSLRTIFNQEEE